MNYESKMLEAFNMPTRKNVERALLISLFKHRGMIKEFSSGEEIVDEIANNFGLTEAQRSAYLETVYKKENRTKKVSLWHRLLFRAADSLAKEKLVSRPTQTMLLTNKREWMLTEDGYDRVLKLLNIPLARKELYPIKSYEVQKIVNQIRVQPRPEDYDPQESTGRTVTVTQETRLRSRAFRHTITEAYGFRCAVCGMKMCSPDALIWEVEAAHIVPRRSKGKDEVLNGLALCRLHHWAFDVGWFTLNEGFQVLASQRIQDLPADFGKFWDYNFMVQLSKRDRMVTLPKEKTLHPHPNAIKWHREHIFTT